MGGSCLDCPFRRDAERGLPDGEDPFLFILKHVISQDQFAEYTPYCCPESGDSCYGQLVFMRNYHFAWVFDPLSNIDELIEGISIDRETYFDGSYQFVHYHEGGKLYGVDWFNETHGKGNKLAKDPVPILPRKMG